MKIEMLDLNFMGTEQVIAAFLLIGEDSATLVETGPTTCLDPLMGGLKQHGVSPEDMSQVFLTHVHLDHSGASGNLTELLPNATFYVHEIGRPHMLDPSKLLKSATRIYGDRMEELWGEVIPVPEDRLKSLEGGEELEINGGSLTAHYTPGHAYHHLAYLEPESGTLIAGDVAGIRLPGQSYVRPPTPPPEIDVDLWRQSIQTVRQIDPQVVSLTHYGSYEDVDRHMGELEQRLQDWLLFVEGQMDEGSEREQIAYELKAKGDAEMLAEGAGPEETEHYDLAGNYEMLVDGIIRYVSRKRKES
ncbi:MBL fold metallo-hydrolase [soil metagenome]